MPRAGTIRGLERGLQVLHELQSRSTSSLNDIHIATRISKPSLLRILNTLEKAGLVSRRLADGHYRIRRDRIDPSGVITLRHNSKLHHIGLGRCLGGTRVLVLAHDLHVRVLNEDGELIRELTLDATRDYQRQAKP